MQPNMQPGGHIGLESDGPDTSSITLDPDGVAGSSGAKEPSWSKVSPCVSNNRVTSLHLLQDHRSRVSSKNLHSTTMVSCAIVVLDFLRLSHHLEGMKLPFRVQARGGANTPNAVGCRHSNGSDRQISSSKPYLAR